jgi:hypothetical protein
MIESENDIMVKCIICFTTCTTVYYLHCILHVEWVLFNANSAIVQLYHRDNRLNCQWDDDEVRFVLDWHS